MNLHGGDAGSRSAFAFPKFRIYFAGALLSMFGHRLNIVATGILVYDLTGSPRDLGFVAATTAIPTVFLNVFGSAVADRFDRRNVLRFAALGSSILLGLLAGLKMAGVVQPWHAYAVAGGMGLMIGLDLPTRQAYFPYLVPPRATRSAVSLNGATMAGASVVVPALGGVMIAAVGTQAGFIAASAGYAAMFLSTFALPSRRIVASARRNVLRDLADGGGFILHHRMFLALIGLAFCSMFFAFGYIQVLPAFVDRFGGGDREVGFLFSAAGLGALSGIIVAGRMRVGGKLGWVILGAAAAYSSTLILVAFSPWFLLALVGAAVAHFGNGFFRETEMLTPLNMVMGIHAVNQSLGVLGGLWAGTVGEITGDIRWGVALGPMIVLTVITNAPGFTSSVCTALPRSKLRGLRGSVPVVISTPSGMPSPSVSATSGLV